MGVKGRVATHSLRKTFGQKVYDESGGNLLVAQEALGHVSIDSTRKYPEVTREMVQGAIRGAFRRQAA